MSALTATFVFAACTGSGSNSRESPRESPRESLRESPCPILTPFAIGSSLTYALVDNSVSYENARDEALGLLFELLPSLAEPGNRVMASWLDNQPDRPLKTFFNEKISIKNPAALPKFPDPPSTPPDSAAAISWGPHCDSVLETHNPTVESINESAPATISAVQEEHLDEVGQFLVSAEAAFANIPKPLEGSDVCGALQKASEILLSPIDGGEWKERNLIIFSDMARFPVTRPEPEECEGLDFDGVTVIVAIFDCPSPASSVCGAWPEHRDTIEDSWTRAFERAGANLPAQFLREEVSSVDTLEALLGR